MYFNGLREISEILPPENNIGGLYLSGIAITQDPKLLTQRNIKAVLSVAKGNFSFEEDIINKVIPAEDNEGFDLQRFFEESIEFIEKSLLKTNVCVHCFAGVSRSSTIVIAYMMKKKNLIFEEALDYVKEKRFQVYPNSGFQKQLRKFEKTIFKKN